MKKSTRALVGLLAMDAILAAGALWMVAQVRNGTWNAPDPAGAITQILSTAGGAIGIVTAVLLVAFFVHRRRGNYVPAARPLASTAATASDSRRTG